MRRHLFDHPQTPSSRSLSALATRSLTLFRYDDVPLNDIGYNLSTRELKHLLAVPVYRLF